MNPSVTSSSNNNHVGTPLPGYHQEWLTRTVHVHDFPSRSAEGGEFVWSPEFEGFGNQWCVRIFPGGCANAAEGMVSLFLYNMSNKAIEIDFGFSVNDRNGNLVAYIRTSTPENFDPVGTATNARGYTDYEKRSKLFNSLVDGALVIEVHMKLTNRLILFHHPSSLKILLANKCNAFS